MLEKLITNLKNSLPESIRKKMGGSAEEDEDEAESEESGADNLKKYESDNASTPDKADKKKKQISMIIRAVIILVPGYIALDEFVLKKDNSEPTIEEMLASAPKRKSRRVVKPVEVPAATTAATNSATDASTTTGTTFSEVTPETELTPVDIPPIENINVLDKNDSSSSQNTASEAPLQVETTPTETPPEVVETKIIDTSVDKKIDQLIDNVDQTNSPIEEIKIPSQSKTQGEQITEVINEPKKETSMVSKIVEDITESPVPAYDQVGRGLVYNCKDKYWACVDKPAYVICNKNMKWNKAKGNSAECVVQNIYNSDEDCAKIQKYNVSTSQPTGFCQ